MNTGATRKAKMGSQPPAEKRVEREKKKGKRAEDWTLAQRGLLFFGPSRSLLAFILLLDSPLIPLALTGYKQ